jgi:hypothetical protein
MAEWCIRVAEVVAVHYRKSFIGQQKAESPAPARRQVRNVGQQRGCVQHVAQVDDECGKPDYQQPGMTGYQTSGNELAGAGKHAHRHELSLPGSERAGGDERAEYHAERRGADQHRHGIAHAGHEAG